MVRRAGRAQAGVDEKEIGLLIRAVQADHEVKRVA